jgi:hypothetical protein
MEFLVKSKTEWENDCLYKILSFDEIIIKFNDDDSEEIKTLFDKVFNLDINQSYVHEFDFQDSFTFKRIR